MIRLFLYVQHLLGVGHLQRMGHLARALAANGAAVDLVSGGLPQPGFEAGGARLLQLPPARAEDDRFQTLVDEAGRPVSEDWRAARRALLLAHLAEAKPDLVVTETFPFGRRLLRFELEPLVENTRAMPHRPRLVASIRDILGGLKTPEKSQAAAAYARAHYDAVLVHGDPELIGLKESFAPADSIASIVRYTGYVTGPSCADLAPAARSARRGVLVSAGGGPVGEALLRSAIGARPLSRLAAEPWRLMVAHALPQSVFAALQEAAGPGVTVERSRPDFPALLARARLSISQAGYNTTTELLAARTPAVLVPFLGRGETEQRVRAARLESLGLAVRLEETDLAPATLAAAIDRAADLNPDQSAARFSLEGAAESARLLLELAGEARAA
jgi:predicted glycosyltransferase